MLSDEVIEKVTERLVNRIEQANAYVLKEIGKSIKKIGTLTPSQAQELVQVFKYGGDYEKIVQELARITELNVYDIYKILEEVAKTDYRFAKQFYKYRKINYIPYSKNKTLQDQVRALASLTAKEYLNISNTKALGFGIINKKGKIIYKGLKEAYYDLLDEAVISVAQGKESFDTAMYRQLKNIGENGLKVIYESGRAVRLDNAVRMNMKSAITSLHMEMQEQLGEDFDSDGVEISVHNNPAPDHEDAQGKQFSTKKEKNQKLSEFEKLQQRGIAKAYDGEEIDLHMELKSGDSAKGYRPIGVMNCYHYIFAIVLGVSKPQYTNKQLKEIKENNQKGFDFDGKHYTNYEGTQLQRQIEKKIREETEAQTLAKASDNEKLINETRSTLNKLYKKYNDLSKISGLPTKINRLRISTFEK